MLYSRHFSLSWLMACMSSVVEYLLLNPACSLGWFSSSFFSSLVVIIFVNSLYIFDSKQIGLFLMSFLFSFLKNITIFALYHILGVRRSVVHFVYSFLSCFALLLVFQGQLDLFPLLSHFSFSSARLPLPMALLVILLRGLFVLLQLGRCHIILTIIILFVPWSYLVLVSLCLVCSVVLSSGFFLGCVFFWPFSSSLMPQLFLGFHLSCASGYLP